MKGAEISISMLIIVIVAAIALVIILGFLGIIPGFQQFFVRPRVENMFCQELVYYRNCASEYIPLRDAQNIESAKLTKKDVPVVPSGEDRDRPYLSEICAYILGKSPSQMGENDWKQCLKRCQCRYE
ncbi:MAG: hypothetical protein QXS69_01400 [Candidatus Aenigmatarchaeota archaeon]